MKEKLIERLVRYAKIDTQSDFNSTQLLQQHQVNGIFCMSYKKNLQKSEWKKLR